MIKILVITFLLGYLFFKLIGMLLKLAIKSSSAANQGQFHRQHQHQSTQNRKPSDGNVNVDYVPNKNKKSKKNFKGGDYVDYEEIK